MLLIDIGNSRLKWTQYLNGQFEGVQRIEYRGRPLSHLFDAQWGELPSPQRVIVSNVAGQSLALAMAAWMQEAWELSPEFVRVEADAFDVRVAYEDPGRFGVDRWVSLIAARHLVSGPVCVVDCGTAITIDVMMANGEHLGGLIAPGLSLMQQSLLENTQGIGDVANFSEPSLLARDTATAVQAGGYWAAVGFIDRILAETQHRMPIALTSIITGGDAPLLLPRLSGTFQHEPDWIMKGLARIAEGKL